MKRLAVIGLLMLAPGDWSFAQDAGNACQDIAAHIGPPDSMASLVFHYPIPELSGPGGVLTLAGNFGRPAMPAAEELFHPAPDLAAIFRSYSGDDYTGIVQVHGFADSSVHAIWTL